VANNETIRSLGENESLRRTVARLTPSDYAVVGSGDDSAVITAADQRFTVTTDTLVQDHDFRLDWSSAYDLGWKAVASNLADVAAMGAVATSLVVALVVDAETEISWLEAFADGLSAACKSLAPGCGIVGGDLAAGSQMVIAVTAHGDLQGRNAVLRSGAKPGDIIALAGTLGRAACGLTLLQSGFEDAASAYDEWVSIQLRPQPPLAAGVEAALAGATSMLDVSDGLARDAARVGKASEVTLQFASQQLSGFEAVLEMAAQSLVARGFQQNGETLTESQLVKNWVLNGGEDHGLLATFDASASIPRAFKPIGVVLPLRTNEAGLPEYVLLDQTALPERGWDSIAS
jgi:thiamine-monophosphate kinase